MMWGIEVRGMLFNALPKFDLLRPQSLSGKSTKEAGKLGATGTTTTATETAATTISSIVDSKRKDRTRAAGCPLCIRHQRLFSVTDHSNNHGISSSSSSTSQSIEHVSVLCVQGRGAQRGKFDNRLLFREPTWPSSLSQTTVVIRARPSNPSSSGTRSSS